MTSPTKPWESSTLQNSAQMTRCANANFPGGAAQIAGRSAPVLPPLPRSSPALSGGVNSYMPYNSGYSSMGYGGMGSYGAPSSYGMPYRSSLYNSYGSYGSGYGGGYGGGYNSYGMYGGGLGGGGAYGDDAERRFIQYAEESSRNTFASVESIVRAVNSISMMLDNTFFAMTSSFRAVLSVAENFGKLRSMFGHIWYTINIFRLFNWLYRKLMAFMGHKVPHSATSVAWKEATKGGLPSAGPRAPSGGSNWPTLAFLGVLVSAPYIISKFLPKYVDKADPVNWKTPGVRAKAAFDFVARNQNELSLLTNDEVTLAPTSVQEEMGLKNSGWAMVICNGRSGVVPLNYLIINKSLEGGNNNNNNNTKILNHKSHTKRVSFGENQIFENVDLEDYMTGKKEIKTHHKKEKESKVSSDSAEVPSSS